MANSEIESLTLKEINERLAILLDKLTSNLAYQKSLMKLYEEKLKEYEAHIAKEKQLYQEYKEYKKLMKENEENR